MSTTEETPRPNITNSNEGPPPTAGQAPAKRLRRDEIVDEATRLFAERGYEGASMADLAERVGLRKASLFHHFASKDVLYTAVLERLLAPVNEAINRALLTEGSFVERLDALSDAMTDVLWAQPFAARLLVREAMDWGPVIRDKLRGTITDVLDTATSFLKAGQEAGLFVEAEPRHTILSLIGAHFMPFLIPSLTEVYVGASVYEQAFLDARKAIAREHARAIVVKRT
jgi:TetR/AcrR family transcriptional regulator